MGIQGEESEINGRNSNQGTLPFMKNMHLLNGERGSSNEDNEVIRTSETMRI
jgi:hypothetical protein